MMAFFKIPKFSVPGKKYEKTRHNLGYLVADHLADISKIDVDREVFRGLLGRGQIFDEDVMIFKPTTFMNLSGEAVREISNYFRHSWVFAKKLTV